MSSHLTSGTVTVVYLSDAGFTVPMACLKCSLVMNIESKISTGIESSSISIMSNYSLIH